MRFIAPEISYAEEDDSRINEPSDIYSLAMTIYALGMRALPFADISNERAACRVAREGKRPPKQHSLGGLTKDKSELLWSIIERMWDQQPRFWPTISNARHEIAQCGLMHFEPTIMVSSTGARSSAATAFVAVPYEAHQQIPSSNTEHQRIGDALLVPGYVSS